MAKEVTVVKKVKNGVLYSDGTIRVERVRLSYPHLGAPYSDGSLDDDGNEKKPSFSVTLLPKKDTHKEVYDLIVERAKELLEENTKGGKRPKVTADKRFFKDGDGELVDDDNAKNGWTLSSRETRRPIVMDKSGEVMVDIAAIDEMFYGGCWGHVIIRPWFQDHQKYGQRINAGLVTARFWKDDDSFGEGRISAAEAASRMDDIDENDDEGGFSNSNNDDDDDGL